MVRLGLLVALLAACRSDPPRPLIEAIQGEWEVWCRTDAESTSSCLGQERDGLYKNFLPGGKLVAGARAGSEMQGTWSLTGDQLVLVFEGGGMRLEEVYRARLAGDRLVLWYPSGGFGSVLGRAGASFTPPASKQSSGSQTSHAVGDVRYRLGLPSGYRLARDDNHRQEWAPASGDGLVVRLTLSPRGQTEVGGKWVTPPCNDRDYGGVSSSGSTIDGVERDTSIGTSICLDPSDQLLMCSAEHTRGYLEPADKAPALALCKSLTVER